MRVSHQFTMPLEVRLSFLRLGPMITLQFQGPTGEVGRLCQAVVSDLVRRESIRPPTLIHVTQDSLTASRQADMLAHLPVSRS